MRPGGMQAALAISSGMAAKTALILSRLAALAACRKQLTILTLLHLRVHRLRHQWDVCILAPAEEIAGIQL